MKVKCINNDGWVNSLTINKVYDVLESEGNVYVIEDNMGDIHIYHESRFEIVPNSFKIKVAEYLTKDRCKLKQCKNAFGEIGTIHEVVDGAITDFEGDIWDENGNGFGSIDNVNELFKNCSMYKIRFELVEDESLEETEFKAGDIVTVIDNNKNYSGQIEWVEKYTPKYKNNYSNSIFDRPSVNELYRVVATAKDVINKLLIQDEATDQVFIISEAGVKLYQHKTEQEDISPLKSLIHKSICEELNEIYIKKNSDYGDSFGKSFTEYGTTMLCIRLEDKLLRLKSLTVDNKEQQVTDESIKDTLMDLANYAIMGLIEMRGSKNE